ncbi:Hydroxyacylglutathione hydrolase [Usitatibacter rugosus]|uniref:Hydroxyacylglutathione hydrolase n=1 Tax=Usitatibacter rugosus TaxID=2732067 RepID=A0A6M4GXC3_9PROT|nr:hydroxyacylglutathione hydrolase [Usitatibacter rugosus]QJR11652.1 Hydroxyacylglutathione hydrolase [Usitatibacter rugosus]
MRIHAVPAFQDNYLWLMEDGGKAAVVDPGDAQPIEAALAERGLELTAILTTHHHGDHVGGVEALAARWKCPIFGPAGESIPRITRKLVESDTIEVPGLGETFSVLDVPGHTAGHIAYVGDGVAFVGDTLFACGCGRLFEGTAEQMAHSLGKLSKLPAATRAYCAHEYTMANIKFAEAVEPGNARLHARHAADAAKRSRGEPTVPSTIGEELATNPFLRCTEPEVVASAERHAGKRLGDAVAVFAEIRAWKNTFR